MGISLDELASRAGVSPETLRKAGKYQKASEQLMQNLRLVETAFNAYQGRSSDPFVTRAAPSLNEEAPANPFGQRGRLVPVVSWAAAGRAGDYGDLATQIEEMVETDCRDPNSFALIIEGDSMEPEFHAGDIVVFAPNSEPRNGDVVVARHKVTGTVYFKRFRRTGKEGERARLESFNPDYSTMDFPLCDFRFIYPAVDMKRKLRR